MLLLEQPARYKFCDKDSDGIDTAPQQKRLAL